MEEWIFEELGLWVIVFVEMYLFMCGVGDDGMLCDEWMEWECCDYVDYDFEFKVVGWVLIWWNWLVKLGELLNWGLDFWMDMWFVIWDGIDMECWV